MSSGTRRLNYTRRQKIKREHAAVTLRSDKDGDPPTFDAVLTLDEYSLPPEARVFIEAYPATAYQRFAYGLVGTLKPQDDRTLTEFGAGEGLQFRVKIVEPLPPGVEGSARPARILAHADRIKPVEAGRRPSLLAVERLDSRDEVWRLELDEDAGPILRVSTHLCPDRHAVVRSPGFVALAMPEILRRILAAALDGELPDPEKDKDSWKYKWLHFGCDLLGTSGLPPELEETESGDEREKWVESAVARFCRDHKIAGAFGKFWSEAGQ